MIIEVKNLCFTYSDKDLNKHIFHEANACFESGKFYAITGASGSGKTTFLALLNKIYKPDSGSILIDGVDLNKIKEDVHRTLNVSVIYQSYNLIDHLNAYENIALAMDIQHIKVDNKKEYIYDILEKVGLNEYDVEASIDYLSGGEQQRVAIARSLASRAKFILADEPTGNLDATLSRNMISLLKKLAREKGLGVIIVTHSQEALRQAEVIYDIQDNKLVKRR